MDSCNRRSWTFVAVGAGLMMLLEHTLSTSSFIFFGSETLGPKNIWLLPIMFCSISFSAIVSQPLAEIWTYRKVSMVGCFLTSLGFLISASTLRLQGWLFFAYAGVVGLGLGLTFHVTYLMVMSHARKYQGLAVGVLEVGAGVGYLLGPYVYTYCIRSTEDKLLIRSLCAVLAFVGSIMYVHPKQTFGSQAYKSGKRICSNTYEGSEGTNTKEECRKEVTIPLVELCSDTQSEAGLSGLGLRLQESYRQRKRSNYLLNISATILPYIPEESEGPSTTATGNCTPALNSSSNNLSKDKSQSDEGDAQGALTGLNDEEIQGIRDTNNIHANIILADKIELESHIGFSGLGFKSDASMTNNNEVEADISSNEMIVDKEIVHDIPSMTKIRSQTLIGRTLRAFGHIQFKYMKSVSFMMVSLGIAFSELALPFVPIAVYAQLSHLRTVNYQRQGEIALLLIYSVDLLSRLVISYLSDSTGFSKRTVFFLSNICATTVIAGLGFASNDKYLYGLSIAYGLCKGTMHATKTVMLADIFGKMDFATTYGLCFCVKGFIHVLATALVMAPEVPYQYAIHPLTLRTNRHYPNYINATESNIYNDILGLFSQLPENEDNTALPFPFFFGLLAIPGFLSFLLWLPEELRLCWRRVCLPDLRIPSSVSTHM